MTKRNCVERQASSLRRLRIQLCLGTALTAAASPALAQVNACSSTSPASGATVVCNGTSTTGVIADSSTGVSVDVSADASVMPASGPTIWLGANADIDIGARATVGNDAIASYAMLLGDGSIVNISGVVRGRGGITGPTQVTGSTGLAGARITLNQGGQIVTAGVASNAAIDGRAGGNTYIINGVIRATGTTGQGIRVGNNDTVTLGATGSITTLSGDSSSPIDGSTKTGVRVTTAAGSLIELHGVGRGIDLGDRADVTIGGTIRSFGDATTANSSGGTGIQVGSASTVRLLAGAQIVTGNTAGLGNQGTGGIGITSYRLTNAPGSTLLIDGLIDTQRAHGIFAGIGDTITIGATGRVTARGTGRGIFGNLQTATNNDVITIDIAGRVESLGTTQALFLSASRASGETVETAARANITIREGGTLFAQSNAAYGQDDGAGTYPEVIDNFIVAGTVARGTAGTVIDLNDGADRITFLPTYALVGNVNGGSDPGGLPEIDTFALDGAAGTSATFDFGATQILNFEAGEKLGAGAWTLTGNTAGLTGIFAVNQGSLTVNGVMSNTGATVASGATLGGTGAFGGTATIADGGTLLGAAGGDMGFGALVLNNSSNINVALGAPGGAALFQIGGALTLDGRLNVSDAGGFGPGSYRLFDYGGVLTNNGLVIQSLPAGFNPGGWSIDTGTTGQISLVVSTIVGDQYWDGANQAPGGVADGRGGSGVWNAGNTNWTNQAGNINAPWASQTGVFAAAGPSVVTVEGAQIFTGLRFLSGASYSLVAGAGGALTTETAATIDTQQAAGQTTAVAIGTAIGGAGGVIKTGAGTLVLSGANGYTGATAVDGGTLLVTGSIASSALTVAAGATLGGTGTVGAAVVSGTIAPGTGTGTLNLASLTLTAGATLLYELGAPGVVGGSVNDLVNVAGNLTLDGSLDIVALPGFGDGIYRLINYGGSLTDNGLVVRTAPDFNYAVQTAVTGQVNLLVASDTAIQFWDGPDTVADGAIDGGTGSWTATRTNWTNVAGSGNRNWGGNFAVFQGAAGTVTVDISAGAVSATGMQFATDGYVLTGASLALTGAGQSVVRVGDGTAGGAVMRATIANALTGTSGLDKQDLGTLILTGANSYSGGTRISAGTLQIGNGGASGSVTGNIVNNAALAFSRSDDTSFAGVISGSGTVTKTGAGALTLTGANSYSGATSVTGGTLRVNGSIAGTVGVAAGATLAGNGQTGSASISGTIAPDGVLTVSGGYNQLAGSTYGWDAGDLVRVTGAAVIAGGRVRVANAANGLRLGDRTAILTASGGRSGAGYAGVDLSSSVTQPFLTLGLSYDATSVYLEAQRNSVTFESVGSTANQRATARAIDRLASGNALYAAIVNVADAATARAGFDAGSGEIHATLKGVLLDESRNQREAVYGRLGQAPDTGLGLWAQAVGAWGDTDGDGNAAALDRSTVGLLFGLDAPLGEGWRGGIIGGYGRTRIDVAARASRAESDGVYLGAFIGGRLGATSVRANVNYAWHDLSTRRTVAVAGFTDTARADYNAHGLQASVEAAHRIDLGSAAVEPFAEIAHAQLRTDAFSERGGPAALNAARQTERAIWSTLGLRGTTPIGEAVQLYGSAAWQHVLEGRTPTAELAFGSGAPFRISGTSLDSDLALLSAGLRIGLGARAGVNIGYSGAIGSATRDHGARARFSVQF